MDYHHHARLTSWSRGVRTKSCRRPAERVEVGPALSPHDMTKPHKTSSWLSTWPALTSGSFDDTPSSVRADAPRPQA